MIHLRTKRKNDVCRQVIVEDSEAAVPVMILELTRNENCIILTAETPDAAEPNLVLERHEDFRNGEYRTILSYKAVEYEHLLLNLTDSQDKQIALIFDPSPEDARRAFLETL